jgi:hypothetical protein
MGALRSLRSLRSLRTVPALRALRALRTLHLRTLRTVRALRSLRTLRSTLRSALRSCITRRIFSRRSVTLRGAIPRHLVLERVALSRSYPRPRRRIARLRDGTWVALAGVAETNQERPP